MTDKVRRAMAAQIEALEAENARLREDLIAVEAERDWWQERAGALEAENAKARRHLDKMLFWADNLSAEYADNRPMFREDYNAAAGFLDGDDNDDDLLARAVQAALEMAKNRIGCRCADPKVCCCLKRCAAIRAISVEDVLARLEQATAPATIEGKPEGMQ